MSVAYIINAHTDQTHLNRLVKALEHKHAYFYIHIDKKSTGSITIPEHPQVYPITPSIAVNWGGFSLVECILRGLRLAHQHEHGRYVLLSGFDYPLAPSEKIISFFNKHKTTDFINTNPMPMYDKHFERIFKYYIEYDLRDRSLKTFLLAKINALIHTSGLRRDVPPEYRKLELYAGSTWWALTGQTVNIILQYLDNNPKFLNHFKHTLNPDEMLFHIIIKNFVETNIAPSLTYHNWTHGGPPYPALLNKDHIAEIKKANQKEQRFLFARKVNSQNIKLFK